MSTFGLPAGDPYQSYIDREAREERREWAHVKASRFGEVVTTAAVQPQGLVTTAAVQPQQNTTRQQEPSNGQSKIR